MLLRTPVLRAWLAALAMACTSPLYALTAAEVGSIAPQTQLDMPLPSGGIYELRSLTVNAVGVFTDADGSPWLRLEGTEAKDEDDFTVFIDAAEGQVEMALVVNTITLEDLGTGLEPLRAMAKARQGKLSYEGKNFSFSAAARAEFKAQGDASPVRVGYFVLQCDEDANLSLMVINWGARVEVLVNERIDPSQVSLHAAAH